MSHDRAFLDNVVTQTLVAEDDGHWQEYAGGYSDWLLQRAAPAEAAAAASTRTATTPATPARKGSGAKLSFKEARELGELPARIESLEQEQHALLESMAGLKGSAMQDAAHRATEISGLLEGVYARWEELEARR